MDLSALLSDFTLRHAIMGATLLGVSSGVLSVFAMLRRQSLLGDALSHAALPGICLAFLLVGSRQLAPLLAGALVSGAVGALLLLLLVRRSRIKEDAGLGIVLSVFFAVGTVLLTYIQGQRGSGQAGLETFLFGQAAAVLPRDIWVMGSVTLVAVGLILLAFKEAKLVTFDPGFARSVGLPAGAIDLALTLLVAVAVVIGLQLVGVVLMSAMLVAPAAAARQWSKSLGQMTVLSVVFAVTSGVSGAIASATVRGLATGPVIVLAISAFVLLSLLFAPGRGLVYAAYQAYQDRANLASQRVLIDLYRLAQRHDDLSYATEEGMLIALYGVNPIRHLERLARQGLIKPAEHMTGEGRHWILTDKGRSRAEELHRLFDADRLERSQLTGAEQ